MRSRCTQCFGYEREGESENERKSVCTCGSLIVQSRTQYSVCVCEFVCVCERGTEREKVCVYILQLDDAVELHIMYLNMCVCVCVCMRERQRACVHTAA